MQKALFLYSSREGQTKKILNYIKEELSEFDCELADLHQIEDIDLALYDRVLIGASIRYGHLNKKLYQFIEKHAEQLALAKAAFFCVNLTARKEAQGKDTPEGSVYIKTFLSKSAWQPKLIGVFAGALYYPRYHLFDKVMIRFIMSLTGGETDTSKEVEYTNWQKVSLFSDNFKKL
ncbi:menaquinone-dependent protoporphyrinogen IX dehydrogenase [Vibrio anguillarum]|uniref:menaquinone-dependent protoporphyrinogen IX dehydrogenase n=1 Tax=Vibrio anguillarum TaxID=55601 RepID=UPI00097E3E05|nr:menaquinone-dependent protoporphyrinogen IX dehydrogenase [Vibrio anguillarum]MBF4284012.1 menaquinone-dependent protoporphyrinogen IX dehydrogenase [Vibrio anguillarum]MBF4288228.1 menaquinone-dependent protoporphyrinogen IX dehydrogenase [Vibrio anguillarum]MBF4340972.1 menaquinone-dependent protoporphyrinogen IX dehydrogenase [Vibrio anguillarum]MBF4358503.1 menaquinone-dependent protoporphyrinogen IX dehydrogenase [Vibrio anguillarum]MBF4380106.1 menaquinone-dependent protoporphyrinogen